MYYEQDDEFNGELLDEVLFDWFPNATTEAELEYEMDCWDNWDD